jgi:enoyl-[acyl-carrier-protein] reductase (NADH)
MDLEKLENTVLELEQNSKQLKSFVEVYAEISKLRNHIVGNATLLKSTASDIESINERLTSQLNSYSEQLEKIDTYLEKRIEELYKDNKHYHKELDGLIISKLNSHKAEIDNTIINQSRQSQTAFENAMRSSFNKLEDKMKSNYEAQTNLLNNLKTLAYIAIGISVAIGGGLAYIVLG